MLASLYPYVFKIPIASLSNEIIKSYKNVCVCVCPVTNLAIFSYIFEFHSLSTIFTYRKMPHGFVLLYDLTTMS